VVAVRKQLQQMVLVALQLLVRAILVALEHGLLVTTMTLAVVVVVLARQAVLAVMLKAALVVLV
jgi:hypothetical protein